MTNRFFFKDVNNEGSFDYKLNGNGNHAPPAEQRQGTLNEQLSYWKGQKRRISQEEYLEETLLENAAFQLATIEIEKYKAVGEPSKSKEYSEIKTQRGRDSMVERLTYLFGKAIHDNGLQRYATVDPTAYNAKITSREREQFYNKYDERHEPIVVYYKSGRAQKSKKIIPKRR